MTVPTHREIRTAQSPNAKSEEDKKKREKERKGAFHRDDNI